VLRFRLLLNTLLNIILISIILVSICGAASAVEAELRPSVSVLMDRVDADERKLADWPELSRYREENTRVPAPAADEARVVFIGDSITDSWGRGVGNFFPGKPYFNRGISGQTTPQMLVRFRADVLALKPRAVVILAGTNDIAGNTGAMTLGMIEDNLASMAELAQSNGIKVILASVLPINDYMAWPQAANRPPQKIRDLNAWIKNFCVRKGFVYLDYHSAMLDAAQALRKEWSGDGLHPNDAGYAVMAPLAETAIRKALSR